MRKFHTISAMAALAALLLAPTLASAQRECALPAPDDDRAVQAADNRSIETAQRTLLSNPQQTSTPQTRNVALPRRRICCRMMPRNRVENLPPTQGNRQDTPRVVQQVIDAPVMQQVIDAPVVQQMISINESHQRTEYVQQAQEIICGEIPIESMIPNVIQEESEPIPHLVRPTRFDASTLSLVSFPNPITETATISWRQPTEAHVAVQIFDATGSLITTIMDNTIPAGDHTVRWDVGQAPAGVYHCRLSVAGSPVGAQLVVTR